jgi:hypothetical protein
MPDTTPQPNFARIGFSGYPVYGNRSYPGSDEVHRELQGTQADRKYREMLDNHGLIATTQRIISALCQQCRWSIAPSIEDDPTAIAAADFVRLQWQQMSVSWGQVLAEMLSAALLGWSWHETVYKHIEGGLGWDGFYFCRQDTRLTWAWDDNGRHVIAMEQLTKAGQHATISAAKSLHYVADPTTGSPEGRAILRSLYIYYRNLMDTLTDLGIGIRHDATGQVVLQIPIDTFTAAAGGDAVATATIDAVKKSVATMQRGERSGVVIPSEIDSDGRQTGWKIDMLSGSQRPRVDGLALAEMYEKRIASALLTQFLLLGQSASGSFALSADQTELLGIVLAGWCTDIADCFNQQAIKPLCELNGIDAKYMPKLTHGPIDGPDLSALANLLGTAVKANILTPDPALEEYVRDSAGLPKLPTPKAP